MLLWVDNKIVTGPNKNILIETLMREMSAKNLRNLKKFLGMQITKKDDKIYISRSEMINEITHSYGDKFPSGKSTDNSKCTL